MIAVHFYDNTKPKKPNTYRNVYAYGSSLANRDTATSRYAKEEMNVPADHVNGVAVTFKGIAVAIPVLDAKNREMELEELEKSLSNFIVTVAEKLGSNPVFVSDLSLDNRVEDTVVYNLLLDLIDEYNDKVDDFGYVTRLLLIDKKYKRKK
jgi:hypothetical protein